MLTCQHLTCAERITLAAFLRPFFVHHNRIDEGLVNPGVSFERRRHWQVDGNLVITGLDRADAIPRVSQLIFSLRGCVAKVVCAGISTSYAKVGRCRGASYFHFQPGMFVEGLTDSSGKVRDKFIFLSVVSYRQLGDVEHV